MPPKKQQKQSLADFLAQTGASGTGGNWADEMEDLPLAPSAKPDGYDPASAVRDYRRGGGGGDRSSRPGGDRDRDGDSRYPPRAERVEVPIPDVAPFTAFIGNLAFETGEEEIREFTGPGTKSVRLVRGPDEKPKGFGYIELETRDALVALLARTGEDFLGRTVRLSVAEPQRGGDDRHSSPWRRDGPPPPISSSSGPSRNYSFNSGGPPSARIPDEDRGERMGFGSKFVPASERPPERPGFGSMRRETSFRSSAGVGGQEEERGERMGMGAKFSPSTPASPGAGSAEDGSFGRRRGGQGMMMLERQTSQAEGVRDWRSAPRSTTMVGPGLNRSESTDKIPGADGPPAARRRLELAPRSAAPTTTTTNEGESPLQSPSVSKPSPFGSAAPVDTASREREIESKVSVPPPTTGRTLERDTAVAADAPKPTAERKASVNPFGAAAPVDTATKEREVEEKLERERIELAQKAREEREKEREREQGDRKLIQRGSAVQVQGAPTGPKALQRPAASINAQSPKSPVGSGQNGFPQRKQSTGPTTTPTSPGASSGGASTNRSSLRKEGFSYSSMAKSVEAPKPAEGNTNGTTATATATKVNGTEETGNAEGEGKGEGEKKVDELAEKVKETSIEA